MAKRAKRDLRSQAERAIDDQFDELILGILGQDGVDQPMKDVLNVAGEGVVGIMTDPSDFGSTAHYVPVGEHELEDVAKMASDALRRSHQVFRENSGG